MSISKPFAPKLSREVIQRCFERNPHGAGFAFAMDNKVSVVKGFFNPDELIQYYELIPPQATILLHFRKASAGEINVKSCHPFRINKDHVMVHNGTIMDFWDEKSSLSDTQRFVNMYLRPIFKNDKYFWRRRTGKYTIGRIVWPGKCIVLRNNGDYVIFNEELGVWDGDTWFSNDGFLDESYYCNTHYPRQLTLPLEFVESKEEEEAVEIEFTRQQQLAE